MGKERSEKIGIVENPRREIERLDLGADLALAVGLTGLPVKASELAILMFEQLSQNPSLGLKWMIDYGRILVGASSTGETAMNLCLKNEKRLMGFVMMRSLVERRPGEWLECEALGRDVIVLNDKPVTAEGSVVMLLHLVDELVRIRTNRLLEDNDVSKEEAMMGAIGQVMRGGFRVVDVSEDLFDGLKGLSGEGLVERSYGSGVVKSIPRRMGGVILDTNEDRVLERIVSDRAKKEIKIGGAGGAMVVGITLTKPLHVGHLLLLSQANSLRKNSGLKKLVIMNNDIGPRVGQMVISLAEMTKMSLTEVVRGLLRGEIEPSLVNAAYRNRSTAVRVEDGIKMKLPSGLLMRMEKETQRLLSEIGFGVEIIAQSSVSEPANGWMDSGFSTLTGGRSMTVLQLEGRSTMAGTVSNFLVNVVGRFGKTVMVDSEAGVGNVVRTLDELGLPVEKRDGLGLVLGLKAASGTNGLAPTIEELKNEVGADNLALVAEFLLATTVLVKEKSGGDYLYRLMLADRKSLIDLFLLKKKELSLTLESLGNISERSIPAKEDNPATEGFLRMSGVAISESKTGVVQKLSLEMIGDQSFRAAVDKYKKYLGEDPEGLLLRLLLEFGPMTRAQLVEQLRKRDLMFGIGTLPQSNELIQSRVMTALLGLGFGSETAISMTKEVYGGKFQLFRRRNKIWDLLISLAGENRIEVSSKQSKMMESSLRNLLSIVLEDG